MDTLSTCLCGFKICTSVGYRLSCNSNRPQTPARPKQHGQSSSSRVHSRIPTQRFKAKGIGLISRFRSRKWKPKRILIVANKADLWLDEEGYSQWERGLVSEHEIFQPFKESLYQLQKLHIPVRVDAMSATVGWNVEDALMRGSMTYE